MKSLEGVAVYAQTWRQLLGLSHEELRTFYQFPGVPRPIQMVKECLAELNGCAVLKAFAAPGPIQEGSDNTRSYAEGFVSATYGFLISRLKLVGKEESSPSKEVVIETLTSNLRIYFGSRGYQPSFVRTIVSIQKTKC